MVHMKLGFDCFMDHKSSMCNPTIHYENMPIQIYWKFYNQKKKETFQIKILIFFKFLLKT